MSKLKQVKRYFQYLVPYLGKEMLILLLMIISGIGSLATPYFLKIIIDDIFPAGNYRQLISLLAALLAIYILRILCTVATDIMYTKVSVRIVSDLRKDIFSDLLVRPILYFKSARLGEVLFTVMNDVENIQTALSSLVLNFLNNIISIIGIVIMLGLLNFKLTLISLLILPLILFSIRKFTPYLQRSFRNIQEAQERMSDFFLETMRNIRVVRSYSTGEWEAGKLESLQKRIRSGHVANTMLNSFNSNIITFLVATGPIIVLIYGGGNVFSGAMTIGGLIAFIQYLNRLYAPTISIMESYNQLTKAVVSMDRVSAYIQPVQKKTSALPDEKRDRHGAVDTGIPAFRSISFSNVSLRIDDIEILKNINLHFERGKIYGLIGPSGSGKSSVVNALCGFFPLASGKVLLDGSISISGLRNWSIVPGLIEKENQLFNDTIAGNIQYGSWHRDRMDIERTARYAGFADVAGHLPNGYDTWINETGTMLSDGQKQRVAISRAFLKDPPVIIFDEATAALDHTLEQKIIDNLRVHYADAIVIFITHRLTSLDRFDYIYSINNGQVNREGSPSCFSTALMYE